MLVQQYPCHFPALSEILISRWRAIPTAVASDCMGRARVMDKAIKLLSGSGALCGQARTVTAMVGDSSAICIAAAECIPGQVLVVDAGGVEDIAVWGGIMTAAAVRLQLGGVVIDGVVRDIAGIRQSGLNVFCRGVIPRGPHEGFGGKIDCRVAAGGVSVAPGDLILGDEDGVAVIPLEMVETVLEAAERHLEKEKGWLDRISLGETIPEIFSLTKTMVDVRSNKP